MEAQDSAEKLLALIVDAGVRSVRTYAGFRSGAEPDFLCRY